MVVPSALLWSSWVPLLVSALLILAFCSVFVMYYKSVLAGEQSTTASAAATLALAVALVAAFIVPGGVIAYVYWCFCDFLTCIFLQTSHPFC